MKFNKIIYLMLFGISIIYPNWSHASEIIKVKDKDGNISYTNIETNRNGADSTEIIEEVITTGAKPASNINYQIENLFNDSNTETKFLSDIRTKRNDLVELLFNYEEQLEEVQFELNANTVKLDKCNINAVYDYFIFFCSGLEIKQERLLNELDIISNSMDNIRTQILALDLQINELGNQNDSLVCKVDEVISGNTFVCLIGKGSKTVKLIGIETPDNNVDFLESLILGKNVLLRFDRIKTGPGNSLLAYVFINDTTMLNALLLRQGRALALSNAEYKYIYEFKEYERLAKDSNTGIWAN